MIRSGKSNHPLLFEKVPHRADSSLVLESTVGTVLDCNYHYHPEMELTYVVSGAGRVLFGTELTSYQPGDLALIGGNVPHLYVSVPEQAPGALSETRVLKIGDDFVKSGLFSLPELAGVRKLFEEARTAVLFRNDPGYKEDFDRLPAISGAERLLFFLDFLLRLAATPRRTLIAPPGEVPPHHSDREPIEKAVRFMQRRFREKITLKDVALSVGMEPESFRRFFRRAVRVSFSDYLIDLRLACAGKLLRETRKSISEIAGEAGFCNLSNFNRLFLDRYQETPRNYRKLH